MDNLKQAVNPYLPSWEYVPDGEPYVFGNRVYVYGSHDFFGGDVYCMGDYVGWSAPVDNLGDWRYEGVIYRKDQDPGNGDLQGNLYAPDVTVGPDGRYYLYYVLSSWGIVSVAVCDEPAGKYEFYGYVHYPDGTRLGEKEGDEPQFDPGVITENGKTYLYTGFCGGGDKSRHGAMCTVLDSDMLTVLEAPVFVAPSCATSAGTGFETASLGNLFGLPYVGMRKPAPIDTTTLNYNWQIWETNAFSIYTKETDEVDEQSAQEAVAAVLRYLSRVGLLRYHCHSGYLSTVVQENEMANVLTPAGGIFRRFVEPGQEVEYGQKMGVILDPFTAEVEAEITCPTSGVVFFALKKPLTTEHEVAFKVIRRLHGGCL